MIISAVAMAVLLLLSKYGKINLAWSWLIVIGTVTTFLTAMFLSMFIELFARLFMHTQKTTRSKATSDQK
jgi:hypothetical protein